MRNLVNLDVSFWVFALGLGATLAVAVLAWILYGRKLNLYLVSGDSTVADQALIPVTSENEVRTRQECVELTLADFQERNYVLKFGYGVFVRFFLVTGSETSGVQLDHKPIESGKYYPIRSGTLLTLGDREYKLVVARGSARTEMFRKFA